MEVHKICKEQLLEEWSNIPLTIFSDGCLFRLYHLKFFRRQWKPLVTSGWYAYEKYSVHEEYRITRIIRFDFSVILYKYRGFIVEIHWNFIRGFPRYYEFKSFVQRSFKLKYEKIYRLRRLVITTINILKCAILSVKL